MDPRRPLELPALKAGRADGPPNYPAETRSPGEIPISKESSGQLEICEVGLRRERDKNPVETKKAESHEAGDTALVLDPLNLSERHL